MANIDNTDKWAVMIVTKKTPEADLYNVRVKVKEAAKQQLFKDMLEIIGEDDKLFDEDGGMVEGENTVRSFKNDLRQTQRQGLAIYFGEPNE
jgi:hypothetical protein